MRVRTRFGIVALTLAVGGCTHWPSAEHRAVTLDSIQELLDERGTQTTQVTQSGSCDVKLNKQLIEQGELLSKLTKQMQMLSSANPTFTNSMCPPATSPAMEYQDKMVVGSVEWVYMPVSGHHYKARVDSGATTSSIHATNIERFERNGNKWVRFELKDDERVEQHVVEAPLMRIASVKQASTAEPILRPVVKLSIALGAAIHESEFTLTDRSQMEFTVLLGRTFLQDLALIDVGRTMIQPKYQAPPATESANDAQNDSKKEQASSTTLINEKTQKKVGSANE